MDLKEFREGQIFKALEFQLTISEDNFMHNIFSILKFDAQKNLQLLRKPVDKDKWVTEPAVVNAFYNPNKNDIGEFHEIPLF